MLAKTSVGNFFNLSDLILHTLYVVDQVCQFNSCCFHCIDPCRIANQHTNETTMQNGNPNNHLPGVPMGLATALRLQSTSLVVLPSQGAPPNLAAGSEQVRS